MNAEFTAKLMAQNVDLEALVQIQADRIVHLEMLVANRNEIIDKLDLTPQTKQLSDEKIKSLYECCWIEDVNGEEFDFNMFARAIEAKVREE